MELQWTNDLATGIDTIDRQHRELFDATNELLRACSRGDAKACALETLTFLSHFIAEHFEAEEAMMIASDYPGYELHKAHHEDFRREFELIRSSVAAHGVTTDTVIHINTLLIHWLTSHIRKADQVMAEHLRAVRPVLEIVPA